MTKLQAWITGLTVFFTGVALLVVGVVINNGVLIPLGSSLVGVGLGALGLKSPSEVP